MIAGERGGPSFFLAGADCQRSLPCMAGGHPPGFSCSLYALSLS